MTTRMPLATTEMRLPRSSTRLQSHPKPLDRATRDSSEVVTASIIKSVVPIATPGMMPKARQPSIAWKEEARRFLLKGRPLRREGGGPRVAGGSRSRKRLEGGTVSILSVRWWWLVVVGGVGVPLVSSMMFPHIKITWWPQPPQPRGWGGSVRAQFGQQLSLAWSGCSFLLFFCFVLLF